MTAPLLIENNPNKKTKEIGNSPGGYVTSDARSAAMRAAGWIDAARAIPHKKTSERYAWSELVEKTVSDLTPMLLFVNDYQGDISHFLSDILDDKSILISSRDQPNALG